MFEDIQCEAIRRDMGWCEATCIKLMEQFIKDTGFEGEFLDYLRDVSDDQLEAARGE